MSHRANGSLGPRPRPRTHELPGRPARDRDTSIRVTLGRPESLPTLEDPEAASESGPLLASASGPDRRPTAEASPPPLEPMSRGGGTTRRGADRPRRPARAPEPVLAAAPAAPRTPNPDEQLGTLLKQVRERLDSISTYQVDITRVERVGGQLQTEEDVVLNVRRNPKAVLLQWVKGPSKAAARSSTRRPSTTA
ncbi:MAG: hypothetical protein U0790_24070 [Isosphaeraceae bacterium]